MIFAACGAGAHLVHPGGLQRAALTAHAAGHRRAWPHLAWVLALPRGAAQPVRLLATEVSSWYRIYLDIMNRFLSRCAISSSTAIAVKQPLLSYEANLARSTP